MGGLKPAPALELPGAKISGITKEREKNFDQSKERGLLSKLGKMSVDAPDPYRADIVRKREEVDEEKVEKQKEEMVGKIEFGRKRSPAVRAEIKGQIDEFSDPVKKDIRQEIRGKVLTLDENLKESEEEVKDKIKEQDIQTKAKEKARDEALRKLSVYYDTSLISYNPDGSIDTTSIKPHNPANNATQKPMADALLAATNASAEYKNAQDELVKIQGSKFEGSGVVKKSVNEMLDETLYVTAVDRKRAVKEFIERLAVEKLKLSNGKIKPADFYKTYFEEKNPATGANESIVQSYFTESDIIKIVDDVTAKTPTASYERAKMNLGDMIDGDVDPLNVVEVIIKNEGLTGDNAEKLRDVAKQISLETHRKGSGDIRSVVLDPGITDSMKIEYVRTYIREFNPDTFEDDLVALKLLKDTINTVKKKAPGVPVPGAPTPPAAPIKTRLNKQIDDLIEAYAEDAAREMAYGESDMTLDEAFKVIDNMKLPAPDKIKEKLEKRFQNARFEIVLDRLTFDYIEGKATLGQMGINAAGNLEPKGVLADYINAGEITKAQAEEIAKYLTKGERNVSFTEAFNKTNHEKRITDAIDQTIKELENASFMSPERKAAEKQRLETMKLVNDLEMDNIQPMFEWFDKLKMGYHKKLLKFQKGLILAGLVVGGVAVVGGGAGAVATLMTGAGAGGLGLSALAIAGGGLILMQTYRLNNARVNLTYRVRSEADVIAERANAQEAFKKASYAYDIIHNKNFTKEQAQIALRRVNLNPDLVDELNDGFDLMDIMKNQIDQTQSKIKSIRSR